MLAKQARLFQEYRHLFGWLPGAERFAIRSSDDTSVNRENVRGMVIFHADGSAAMRCTRDGQAVYFSGRKE